MANVAIEFKNIIKIFPGTTALDDVSFSVNCGEIHALMGENGAGKSTLMNVLFGVFAADYGSIFIDGEEVHFASPHDALRRGISKVHQEVNAINTLTVGENMLLGVEPVKGIMIDRAKLHATANTILQELGCNFRSETSMAALRSGQLQMVAIAKAIFNNARIIAFDEPTSALSLEETEVLLETIMKLKAQGITIIIVSHKIDEIFRIADRVTVLRDGKYINTCDIKGLTQSELIRMMVGRDAAAFAVRHLPSCVNRDKVVLEVRHLCGEGFDDISFELYQGEILSLCGLMGAGRTEIVRAIFGADRHTSGEIYVDGEKVTISSPKSALKHGIGLLPEERKTQGFIGVFTNAVNMVLPNLRHYTFCNVVRMPRILDNFQNKTETVRLNNRDPGTFTRNLSGGNQQKVVVAKWLSTNAKILIFDEPTKGIDVGAKEEIHLLMEQYVAEGNAIIMVSSELPEAVGLSDRALVVKNGSLIAQLEKCDVNEERIMHAIMEEGK